MYTKNFYLLGALRKRKMVQNDFKMIRVVT